jgi:hypothetical protein
MTTSLPASLRGRRWTAAIALPATFAALIASTLLDHLNESGPIAAQVTATRADPSAVATLGLVEMLAAALLGLAVLGLVGEIRSRGHVLATAAGVVGVLGVVGMTAISVNHLQLAAGAAVDPAHTAAVIDRMHASIVVIVPLFFAAPIALLLLAIAARRARLAPLWGFVLLVAFFVIDLIPVLPGGELIPLVLGLAGSLGVASRLVRPERPTVAEQGAAGRPLHSSPAADVSR